MKLSKQKQVDPARDGDEMVTLHRTAQGPLRFKGAPRIQRSQTTNGIEAKVVLWECKTGGFVAQLELDGPCGQHAFAKRVKKAAEAVSFLESLADEVSVSPEPKLGRGKLKPIEDVAKLLLTRSRNQLVRERYAQLISESSAACATTWPTEFRD